MNAVRLEPASGAPAQPLAVGDQIVYLTTVEWPVLVRFAAWLSRVSLPDRNGLRRFIVTNYGVIPARNGWGSIKP